MKKITIPGRQYQISSNLVPADFAVLVDVDNLKSLGYSWAATEYERSDDMEYDDAIPVGNDPAPGSRHVMFVGLWES